MTTEKRQISSDEDKKIREEINAVSKDINAPIKWTWISVCCILTVLSAIHIYYFDESNWSLISKLIVCVCPIGIWVIVEIKFKGRKKKQKYLNELQTLADKGLIDILKIPTRRVIVFKEKEDEGTLYLIEDTDGDSIYLWDDQWLIPEKLKFPKQNIEIYLDKSFIWALSRKVCCYGDGIEVVKIPGDKKWIFFDKHGLPGDMEKPNKTFDTILAELKNVA